MSNEIRYIPADGRPMTVTMGLRALDLNNWIEVDSHFADEIAQKKNLYATHHDQVIATDPRGDAGAAEVYELLREFLPQRFPELYPTAIDVDDSVHPIEAAGALVQEDLCIMSNIDNQWVLTSASLAFPSRWDLTEKIGRNMHQIHDPVPHYESRIGYAADAMFNKLDVGRPYWRINWTVLDKPDLFQPSAEGRYKRGEVGATGIFEHDVYFRSERQTLRFLPNSGDILFTIRTYVNSLAEVTAQHPEFRAELGATLRSADESQLDYKGWHPLWDDLMAWSQA